MSVDPKFSAAGRRSKQVQAERAAAEKPHPNSTLGRLLDINNDHYDPEEAARVEKERAAYIAEQEAYVRALKAVA